jgi:DNA-binding phage protein
MTSPTRPAPPRGAQGNLLWDAGTGRFDPIRLRLALVLREWTAGSFAVDTGCGRSSVYKALQGQGVRDRTAIAIMHGLGQREPRLPRLE